MTTDIYGIKDPQWMKKNSPPVSARGSRRSRQESISDPAKRDLSRIRRRRSRNSGLRRFRHLMKRPDFSRRFWITTAVVMILILGALLTWELFFHYPKPEPDYTDDVYHAVVE